MGGLGGGGPFGGTPGGTPKGMKGSQSGGPGGGPSGAAGVGNALVIQVVCVYPLAEVGIAGGWGWWSCGLVGGNLVGCGQSGQGKRVSGCG